MVDNNYKKIKERMKQRSMELWGIEDAKAVDPVIEMLLDVFSYELSKLNQDVKISDTKLLERISKILVHENWYLPAPSHGLISAQPAGKISEVDKTSQVFFQKVIHGEVIDVFFTPIDKQKIIQSSVYCVAFDDQLVFNHDDSLSKISISGIGENKIPDYTAWVGIDIEESLLNGANDLPICILLNDSYLDSYLKMIKVYDKDGNQLELLQNEEDKINNKEHYYPTVFRYYQNYLFTLGLTNSTKKKYKLSEVCKDHFREETIEQFDKELFWLKLSFPIAFVKEELEKLNVSLNTFPVVNRKHGNKHHNIARNGKIVSLTPNEGEYFLNVETLVDNQGKKYKNVLKSDLDNLGGSFSLYFGDLEQFDERNAKSILHQVIQIVREEGSSFSAVGYDILNAYLGDINSKLNELEKKVNFRYKNVSDNSDKVYLQTVPLKGTEEYQCGYWITNANLANGIEKSSVLNQYESVKFQGGRIKFQTNTVGGLVRNKPNEKISSFRYGLLSKDRIVSDEDIMEFVNMSVGSIVKKVKVESGVGIAIHKKQGLVRTIKVSIEISENGKLESENKKRLAHFLQLGLENKSIHKTPYQVNII